MWLRIASGQGLGEAVEVGDEPVTIGSGEGCRLRIPDADVAALHASVRREGDRVLLTVLASEPPILLDGRPVEQTAELGEGAELLVADVTLAATSERPDSGDLARRHRRLDHAVGEVEGPSEVEPVAGVRRRLRLATTLGVLALAVAAVLGALAIAGTFSGGRGGLTTAQVVDQARAATVRIDVAGPGSAGEGSGWVLDARRGLVVTNFHVVNGSRSFSVTGAGGSTGAHVVAASPCDDIALLRVTDPTGLRAMALGSRGMVSPGDAVTALGFPANAGNQPHLTTTAGVVSVVSAPLDAPDRDTPSLPDVMQSTAAVNPGNSGGPLLDDQARLVAMNFATLNAQGGEPIQGQAYAIGVDRIRDVVPKLAQGRSLGWPGFSLRVPSAGFLAARRLPAGVVAGNALPGTPAARAGLGDGQVLLVGIAGHRIGRNLKSYCDAVHGLRGATTVQVIERPGGSPRSVRLSFG